MNPSVPPMNRTATAASKKPTSRRVNPSPFTALVSSSEMDDAPAERQLNIRLDPQHLGGVYANFANITFSPYEFTITFARIDHEVEEGEVPGVVVARINMSSRFYEELLAAMQDARSQWAPREGIRNLPETEEER